MKTTRQLKPASLLPQTIVPSVMSAQQTTLSPQAFPSVATTGSDVLLLTQTLPQQISKAEVQPYSFVADAPATAGFPTIGKLGSYCRPGYPPCSAAKDKHACCASTPAGCDADCVDGRFVIPATSGPPMVGGSCTTWGPCYSSKDKDACCANKPDGCDADCVDGRFDPASRQSRAPAPPGAMVAEALSDFVAVDDSLVADITQVAPGTFNFALRHRGFPRLPRVAQVGHLRGYGYGKGSPRMKVGETWDVATTVRLDPDFRPSRRSCYIMQPVVDQSYLTLTDLRGDLVTARLMFLPFGRTGPAQTVRTFTIRRGEWTRIVVRVRFADDGFYKCSVNGDVFSGLPNADTARPGLRKRNKWGLYTTATVDVAGNLLNDSTVQHRDIYIRRVS
jgi:hypothetical protein